MDHCELIAGLLIQNDHPPFFFHTCSSLLFLLLCSLLHRYPLSFCLCSPFFLLCLSLLLLYLSCLLLLCCRQRPHHLFFFPRCLSLCPLSCSFKLHLNLFAGHSGRLVVVVVVKDKGGKKFVEVLRQKLVIFYMSAVLCTDLRVQS